MKPYYNMRMTFPRLILICTLALFFADPSKGETAPDFSHSSDIEAVQLLEQVRNEISRSPSANESTCDQNQGATCNFKLVCDRLRPNRNSLVLYQNKQGESIPNYRLLYLQGQIDQCRNNISLNSVKSQSPGSPSQPAKLAFLNARKALLASVVAHHEEESIIKVEQTMIETALTPTGDSSLASSLTRDQLAKYILKAEESAGVHLSAETRTKWIDSLDLSTRSKKTNQITISGKNPFIDTLLLLSPEAAGGQNKMENYRSQFQTGLNRGFDIFKDVQNRIISVIAQRKNGGNDAEISNLITRIRTIKMGPPPSIAFFKVGFCSTPNAYYDQLTHSFVLCPQLLQLPTATLQAVIAHELGHAIDPCVTTYSLDQVSGPFPNGHGNSDESLQNQFAPGLELSRFEPTLPEQSKSNFSAFDRDYLDSFWSYGDKHPVFSRQVNPIQSNANPFASVISCLQDKNSVGARMGETSPAKLELMQKIKALEQSGAGENDSQLKELKQTFSRMDRIYAQRTACSFMASAGGHSQMQEAFADWISSEVMARSMDIRTQADRSNRAFEALAVFGATTCRNTDPDIATTAIQTLIQAGCQQRGSQFTHDLDNMTSNDDPHPESWNRISRIFMANPTIRHALSCQAMPEVKHCE